MRHTRPPTKPAAEEHDADGAAFGDVPEHALDGEAAEAGHGPGAEAVGALGRGQGGVGGPFFPEGGVGAEQGDYGEGVAGCGEGGEEVCVFGGGWVGEGWGQDGEAEELAGCEAEEDEDCCVD